MLQSGFQPAVAHLSEVPAGLLLEDVGTGTTMTLDEGQGMGTGAIMTLEERCGMDAGPTITLEERREMPGGMSVFQGLPLQDHTGGTGVLLPPAAPKPNQC
jgi:hypothetical protein